ncbi:unnamed protein product [Effrenium voratum]|nr:unnamed protein product [Effrenium voratum]
MELRAALSPVAVALEAKEAKEASASGRKSGPKSKAGKKASKKPLPTIRLEQILQAAAFPEEILDGSNQWVCPQCDRKVDARKTTRLSKLPPYLHVTVERYHFDSESHERKRLAHPVSFPRRLELCHLVEAQGAGESATLPVAYECIGFLEHVSDSAHSGHYRATLLREEEEPHVASKGGDEVCEPLPKRPKIDDGDAAAGAPQRGSWWRLDDETVTAADGESKAEGSEATVSPLCERIESSTAYLVLYRRCDHDPGQLSCGRRSGRVRCAPPLAPELLRAVDEHNTELRRQRKEFDSNSLAVERFTAERRRAVTCLAQALQQEADRADGKADLTFVPTRWLEKFLRGEDRTLQNILEGDASVSVYPKALSNL